MAKESLLIIAIVPAHNEEAQIKTTLDHLMAQTIRPDHIIVALDNCNDDTERIVSSYAGVEWFNTQDNDAKKAGALNQAVEYMTARYKEPDFLLQVDADSRLHPNFVRAALAELEANVELGGVCGRFTLTPYHGGSLWLYILQDLEYAMADSTRVQRRMSTHVLSGTGTLLRWAHLDRSGNIWDERSIVEDYRLSLDLERHGREIAFGKDVHLETDYMPSVRALWKQRVRWILGTTEELLREGWRPHTRQQILVQAQTGIMGGATILFIVYLAVMLAAGAAARWHILGQLMLAVTFADRLYRSRYIRRPTALKLIVHLSLLAPFIYYLGWVACWYYATCRAVLNRPLRAW